MLQVYLVDSCKSVICGYRRQILGSGGIEN